MKKCAHGQIVHEIYWDRGPIEDLGLIGALTNCALCGEPVLVWGSEDADGNYVYCDRELYDDEKAQLLLLGHQVKNQKMKAMKKVPDGRQSNGRAKQHSHR